MDEIKKQLGRAHQSATATASHDTDSSPAGSRAVPAAASSGAAAGGAGGRSARSDESDAGSRLYFEAESAFANDKFDEAIKLFSQVVAQQSDDDEYSVKARIELGRCYYEKGDFAGTIRHYSQLIQAIPRLPQIGEVLYYIAMSYGKSGDKGKAKSILVKARASADDEPALRRKIDRAVRDLEG